MFGNSAEKSTSEFNVDTSVPKLAGIGVINVLAAALLGYALKSVIGGGGLTIGNILAVIGANVLFMVLILLQVLFIKSLKVQGLIVGLETAALVAPFVLSWSSALLLATALLFLFLFKAVKGGMGEMDNQIKIQFLAIERHTLPSVITGLSIFVSILYVSASGIGASFVSRDAFRVLLKPADPLIQSLLVKDFSIDMTMAKFSEALTAKQFGDAFTNLPPSAKSQAMTEVIRQLHLQAEGYGITFKNTDSISDVFYAYAGKKFDAIPKNYRLVIPYVLFALTYFTVKSLGGLLRWVISTPAYVLYQFLLSIGFARIGLESRSREIIIVS